MKKILGIVVAFIGFSLVVTQSSSCKKDRTCNATVFVIDSLGTPVTGVKVTMYSDEVSAETGVVSKILDDKTTGKDGRVDFEQKLPNILFMVVSKSGYTPLKPGIQSIKFQESSRWFQTVEMIKN
ncbi:MAG: hypothetical protein K1X82_14725 [Bacteroidia bacterium]|nr:hypothetical protein [Bacteroidia bacterium]